MLKLLPQRDKREPKPNADAPNNPQTTRPAEEHDEPGNELGKGARVWRVYVQETEQADKEMCDDWDKSLDVMLIFAALFSAISTAFIIESMKKLQPDPADTSASTLLDISRTLAAISNNQPVLMPPLPDPASKTFTPSRASILVNMLWLTSLIISVGVSLMAMLAKKWCHRFLSARSGPYHEQARRRQKRWDSILAWRMQGVMDGLPLLMHLALGELNRTLFLP
ncbi:hypothetical protein BDV93DRAFT_219233 [Ceratobasidium sp. AG-I]|nr:hypothetical protein BDV93DRAFT_219233 [Ceratobasidium sp. AG-I]